MIGKTILHDKITQKLGEGGMGVVYKAEDTKLNREVAIKFLPRQIAPVQEERERCKVEAQPAAALNHPNIAKSYQEHSGWPFFIRVEPMAVPLRSDPRYAPFFRRMGLEP